MLKRVFKHSGFHILVFGFFMTLFNWPILTIADREHDQTLFGFLFLAWGLLILLLSLIGISVKEDGSEDAGE